MVKRFLEVEGRGIALMSVVFARRVRWVGTSDLNHAEVTHGIRRTIPNLIEAFSKGTKAHLDAEVMRSSAKGMWKGQKNKITLDGSIVDSL